MTVTVPRGTSDPGASDTDPPPAGDTAAADAAPGRRDPTGYEHVASLFVERAGLPPDHPRQKSLRDDLVCGYAPVARHIAQRYGYRGENADDLEQVATVGLILAVDRFEPGRGVDFLSYAVPTITGEVLRHFRDRASTIRVPRRLRALQAAIYDAGAELGQRHGRAARPSEIARHLGIEVDEVLEGLSARYAGHPSSLDEPAPTDDGRTGDMARFGAALSVVEPDFGLVEDRDAVAPLLAELPERERHILMLRFFKGMTQTEIANEVGLSQMHVSRLLSRTLDRMRRRLALG